jgi:ABC-type transport system substrate-binding protein
MRQVLSVSNRRFFPSWRQWKQLHKILSPKERVSLRIATTIILLSCIAMMGLFALEHRIEIPAVGGEYTEGLIGEPQFINPLYASANNADEDLARLVFSGLLKWDATEGFIPDLASEYTVNEDGTIYTLSIRDDATFHDGEQVRARDVLFTINAIQNPSYRSPLAQQFDGVSVIQEDDKTISFILEEPFAPFQQYLTVGIMPASQWAEIMPQSAPLAALNLQPIGSGPYKFKEFSKDKNGNIHSYTLERNPDYFAGAPLIETLTFKFYTDASSATQALEDKHVEGVSLVDYSQIETVRENKNVTLLEPLMPRLVTLYFNEQTNLVLTDIIVRRAIMQGIDTATMTSTLFGESGVVASGPLVQGMLGFAERESLFNRSAANMALDESGYEKQSYGEARLVKEDLADEIRELQGEEITESEAEEIEEETEEEEVEVETTKEIIEEDTEETEEELDTEESAEEIEEVIETPSNDPILKFTLTTTASPELEMAAELIKTDLAEIGITIEIQTVPAELFYTEVIEPRNFEILLTPVMLGADPDIYSYWHSSQIDSGLNLAGYENEDVDTLLDEARVETDETIRTEKYKQFQELVTADMPAVFLYQSPYSYAVAEKIQNVLIDAITHPSDRFANIQKWYSKTKKSLK